MTLADRKVLRQIGQNVIASHTDNTLLKMWSGIEQRFIMLRDAKTEAGEFYVRVDSCRFG